MIITNFHFVSSELAETGKRPQSVEVVIQDGNFHSIYSDLNFLRRSDLAGITRTDDRLSGSQHESTRDRWHALKREAIDERQAPMVSSIG
jgi:hypothetical protein